VNDIDVVKSGNSTVGRMAGCGLDIWGRRSINGIGDLYRENSL
jgi:hypothetical protein